MWESPGLMVCGMAIRGLFFGVLMLVVCAFVTLGVGSLLEQRAEVPDDGTVPADITTPSVANGAVKPSDSHWMF
jgi:hypothetical protein